MYVDAYGFKTMILASSLLVLPASVVIHTSTSGVLWRWLAILGVATGILVVIGAAWVIDGDQEGVLAIIAFIGFLGVPLWVLLVSVSMVMKSELPARGAD